VGDEIVGHEKDQAAVDLLAVDPDELAALRLVLLESVRVGGERRRGPAERGVLGLFRGGRGGGTLDRRVAVEIEVHEVG
jgi:hypothetical protein